MNSYKKIKRVDFENGEEYEFLAEGVFSDGHLAYSKYQKDGTILDGDETAYIQVRVNNKLVMINV